MKKFSALFISVGLVMSGSGLVGLFTSTALAAPACQQTGFFKDGINLTAAQVGGNVTETLNATGCNIGVYFNAAHPGKVKGGTVYGANYFGVVVDGGVGNVSVNVENSTVRNIGEVPFNGAQHGVAIYYYAQDTSGSATGNVFGNTVNNYQKGGIVANGQKASVVVHNNTVTGLGPVDFIAQNGIQISRGASGSIHSNTVSGNSYTGTNNASSAGILIFGGWGSPLTTNISVNNNTLTNNDVGIYFANYNADASAGPTTATNNSAHNNRISNSAITNISGNGSNVGYQAGISDSGNTDSIHNNTISGAGYAPTDTSSAFVLPIDTTAPYSIKANVHNNTYDGSPL